MRVATALNEGNTPEQLIDILFETLGTLIPIDRIGLAMLGPEGMLVSRYVRSKPPILLGKGAAGCIVGSSLEPILRERKIRIIDDLEAYMVEHPHSTTTPLLIQEGMRSSLTLPLLVEDRPIGVLFFTSTRTYAYHQEHVGFLRGLAGALAVAIERSAMVAELRHANQELRTVDQLKTNFLSNLSHELRTPLSQVLSYSYALDDEVAGSLAPDQHAYLKQIISGAECLQDLLSNLFDFTALEAGVFSLERVPVDFKALVSEVAEDLRPSVEKKGLTLHVDLGEDAIGLEGDPPRLAQILRILLHNACKFTPPPGDVTVKVGRCQGQVWAEVADTGIGIAPEQQPHIFQKFFQVEGGPARPYGGAGLGLALAKALAEAHGGTITLQSELGKGSVFRLTLPQT
ncbi:MAG TPA: HAMP domain-containing sensor histidine kinase [Stenomitos sp.]